MRFFGKGLDIFSFFLRSAIYDILKNLIFTKLLLVSGKKEHPCRSPKSDFHQYLLRIHSRWGFLPEFLSSEKEHPETFQEYLHSLDRITSWPTAVCPGASSRNHGFLILVRTICSQTFQRISLSASITAILRSLPKSMIFEILCILWWHCEQPGSRGIHHTLHTGDICIIPPNTQHSLGILMTALPFNIIVRGIYFPGYFLPVLPLIALAEIFSHVLYQKRRGTSLIFHTGEDADSFHSGGSLHWIYASRQIPLLFLTPTDDAVGRLLRYLEMILNPFSQNLPATAVFRRSWIVSARITVQPHFTTHYCTFRITAPPISAHLSEVKAALFFTIIKGLWSSASQPCIAGDPSLSISSICELTGYENPEHLYEII